jgi:hypothetical protein
MFSLYISKVFDESPPLSGKMQLPPRQNDDLKVRPARGDDGVIQPRRLRAGNYLGG